MKLIKPYVYTHDVCTNKIPPELYYSENANVRKNTQYKLLALNHVERILTIALRNI